MADSRLHRTAAQQPYSPANHGHFLALEAEVWSLDPVSLWITGDKALESGDRKAAPGADTETFDTQTEIAFDKPCPAVELLERSRELRNTLQASLFEHGLLFLATGTPLMEPPGGHSFSERQRTREWRRILGDAHLLETSITAGQHVHVDIGNLDVAVAVANRLRPWLPVVDALVVNSPFLHGAFTRKASTRAFLWPNVATYREATGYPDTYAEYKTEGLNFLRSISVDIEDLTRVHDAVRPHFMYETVEARGADVPLTADDATVHGLFIQALIKTILLELESGAPPAACPDPASYYARARIASAANGIRSTLVDPRSLELRSARELLTETFDYAAPGFAALGSGEVTERLIDRILRLGTGAERQLAMWAAVNYSHENATAPDMALQGAALTPTELQDLALVIALQSVSGNLDDDHIGLVPTTTDPLVERLLAANAVNERRLERLRGLSIGDGFTVLDKFGFTWTSLSG